MKSLVFCLLLVPLAACTGQKRVIANKPVMKVNGTEVNTKEFADRLALRLRNYDALAVKDEANLKRAKEETIKAIVLEMIARDYAAKHGIKVDAKDLDQEIEKIRSKYPDDLAFRRVLAQENLSFEAWRSDLELTLLQKKIFSHITGTLPEPTDAEMNRYYEENKKLFQRPARIQLRQIVTDKEENAKRIMSEIQEGANFARLAKEFSVAPEAADEGNVGWIEKGTLEVFDTCFKLNVGARSKILKSPYGYHIIEVLKKEPEARLSFQEAKAKIRSLILERKEQAAFSAWLEQEVRKSSVHRNDELIKAIKVTTRGI